MASKRQLQRLQRYYFRDLEQWRKTTERERDVKTFVDAPVRSFLPSPATGWIEFVNKERYWISYTRKKDVQLRVATDIAELLNRYLDALAEGSATKRVRCLKVIARELTTHMVPARAEHLSIVVANGSYSPGARRDDESPYLSLPLLSAGGGSIAGVYTSLSDFLTGSYSHRLNRCRYCNGLFISPDDRKYEYCPKTDHRQEYWRENAEYFKDATAEGRKRKKERERER